MSSLIHDIKTERQNVSAGLPPAYKLAPAAFYAALAVSTLLSLYFYLSKKAYEANEASMQSRLQAAQTEEAGIIASQQAIVDEAKKAEAYAKWLEGSRPLQPVTVAVGRSMGKESTVAELSLTRNPEIPAHTLMQLKVDGGGGSQVETTLDAIYALNYQTYSAQQVKGPTSTDFQAILIHTEN
jgi:hypothetical protein